MHSPGQRGSRMVTVRPLHASDGDTVHREHGLVSDTTDEDHAAAAPGHSLSGAAAGRSPTSSASRARRLRPAMTYAGPGWMVPARPTRVNAASVALSRIPSGSRPRAYPSGRGDPAAATQSRSCGPVSTSRSAAGGQDRARASNLLLYAVRTSKETVRGSAFTF